MARTRALVAGAALVGASAIGTLFAPSADAATYDVNFTFDNADGNVGDGQCDVIPNFGGLECSLRAAIQEANASAGADTINLFPSPVYSLSTAGIDDTAALGDLDILEDVTIVGGGSTLTVSNFIRGFDVRAGTLTMSGMTVTGGTAESDTGKGGNVQVVGGSLVLSDSSLDNGTASTAGAGLEVTDPASATLTDVDFDSNSASVNGGALHATGAATTDITGGTVTDNTASEEGGGFWNGTGTMTVDGTTFTGNDAQGSGAAQGGGALFQQPTGSLVVQNSTIGTVDDPNTASGTAAPDGGGNGGGILVDQGSLTVTDSPIVGNTANRAGGGIESNAATTFTVTGTDFTSNTANVNGGAIHVSGTGSSQVTGGTVSDNTALQEGGGFWNNAGTMTVIGTTFTGNDAQGSLAAQGGGALFQQPVGTLSVTDATFGENSATGAAAPDGGGNGGAILNDQGTLEVDGATFVENAANRAGGAVEANIGTTTIERSVARFNTAAVNGGVLHLSGAAQANVTELWADDNEATNEGGALWVSPTGILDVYRSLFTDNTATVDGGALFNNGGDLTVISSTISANTGTVTGGGLADVAGSDTTFEYVTAVDNTSPLGANAQVNGNLTSSASVFAYPHGDDNCDVVGAVTSGGANHADDASCGFGPGEDDQGDPRLGPLRDNGGPTFTRFPLAGSPLVDRVPANVCHTSDQRTVNRPFGTACDTGAIEAVFPGHGFTDSTPFYEAAIRWITSNVNDPQILRGFPDSTFRPAANLNRGQAARLLYNEAGAPDVSSLPPHGFTDVSPFFEDAVRYAASEGLFVGYTGNRCTSRGLTSPCFIEGDDVTRGQLTRAKYQFAGAPDVSNLPANPYGDVPAFYEDAVRWAAGNNLVTGYRDGTFRLAIAINRGNAARIDYALARTPAAWDDPGSAPLQVLFRPSVESAAD